MVYITEKLYKQFIMQALYSFIRISFSQTFSIWVYRLYGNSF